MSLLILHQQKFECWC